MEVKNHALFYKIQNNTKYRDLFLRWLEDFSVVAGPSQREKVGWFELLVFFPNIIIKQQRLTRMGIN